MITTYLEELIHKGKAVFKTWTTGLGGVMRMGIQPSTYIVVTDLYYDGFVDEDSLTSVLAFEPRRTQQIYIRSDVNQLYLTTRSDIMSIVDPVTQNAFLYAVGQKHWDMYSIHAKELKISVGILPAPVAYLVPDYTTMLQQNNEESQFGYGVTKNTLKKAVLNGTNVVPLTNNQLQLAGTTPVSDQFIAPVTALQNPSAKAEFGASSVPCIQIMYVQINEPLPKHLNPGG